ncbi:MAG: prenyltransferase [Alphaproteobacteria bacterium]|nr:MAG: prenyltransferase [Alphaproteobacteria bacterium]
MKNLYLREGPFPHGFFDGAVARIVELQRDDGSIPWFDGGVVDPWNHLEAAMGLAVAGERARSEKAFAYLAETQLGDGSWHGQYGAAVPMDESHYTGDGNEKKIRDTNFSAYIATGVWHHHLLYQDENFFRTYWPIVKSAMDFVLSLQSDHGDIRWAAHDAHTPEDDALITGCSSIYKSLECAMRLAEVAGDQEARKQWALARTRLGQALRDKPERFDRNWEEKSRYSMDWYYPVLTGVMRGEAARARIASKWETFVAEEKGCRCVKEQPWVTVAESCELAMALMNIGQTARARELFSWQHQWRCDEGAYWMGYQFKEDVPWPVERPAWTAGAVILAADALHHATPAAKLFTEILPEEPITEARRTSKASE